MKDFYYKLKCFFLLFKRKNRIAKQNAEKLVNMIHSGYPDRKMREAIRQGRFYDVQKMAYEHDMKFRQMQQKSIKIEHIPEPDDMLGSSVIYQYGLKGNDTEAFSSAGEAWEHVLGEEYQKLKQRHKFRTPVSRRENDDN